jgi:hypothetical protein
MKNCRANEQSPVSDTVMYAQLQNNCLRTEFKELLSDVPGDISFASYAFGSKPDAVNFWMGEDTSVTSLHKDPFEVLAF